jgi:hypothetical protein
MKNEKLSISVDFLIGAFPNVKQETTTLTLTGHAARNSTPSTLESNHMDRINGSVARQRCVQKKFICVTNMRLLGTTPYLPRIDNMDLTN